MEGILIYFGLSVFLWQKCTVEKTSVIELSGALEPFKRKILEDMRLLRKGQFTLNQKGTWSTSSGFHQVPNTNVWIFKHGGYARCCSVTYAQLSRSIFINDKELDEEPDNEAEDECEQDDHYTLLPFFCDNRDLFKYYRRQLPPDDQPSPTRKQIFCKRRYDLSCDKSSEDIFYTPGSFFAYGNEYSENDWSKRLSGALRDFLAPHFQPDEITYSAELAMKFKREHTRITGLPREFASSYIFHGSPDIIIRNAVIVSSTQHEDSTAGDDSATSEDNVIEVKLQVDAQEPTPPHLGELISAMHLKLVQKLLKLVYKDEDQITAKLQEDSISTRGLYLNKVTGAILCDVAIPIYNVDADAECLTTVHVRDRTGSYLTPEVLCTYLKNLVYI